ncbi:MAG TPA: DNA repair protein RecO [Eubacteriales bacterium]|jgi:DNA repair protein RecO (recombination protein O)|nr:DNA repair protein RecO [Clostridia bacterium]HRR89857.1 DNA repair protein RecO [Eubacteriales bacterium]HRU84878.1 DNA repair protein RecO [Eubacteriales bacterium]
MDKIKVNGIVVRSVPYGDYDKVLTLVTPERGKLAASARSVRKSSAKLKYAAEPFSFGEYMLAPASGGKLVVCECMQHDNFFGLTRDLERYYGGFMLLEILEKLSSEEPNGPLMAAVLDGLKLLCYTDAAPKVAVSGTLLTVLEVLGYKLNFTSCAACGKELGESVYFDADSGFVCGVCRRPETSRTIQKSVFLHLLELDSIKSGCISDNIDGGIATAGSELMVNILTELAGIKIKSASMFLYT